jgi:hypothetical protein
MAHELIELQRHMQTYGDLTNTYNIKVSCTNCGFNGNAAIPRVQPVAEKIQCPNCRCDTAKKMATR